MNAEQLAVIEARATAAQAGPLTASENYLIGGYWVQTEEERPRERAHADLWDRLEDAVLYAHAREDILALVAEVRLLWTVAERVLDTGDTLALILPGVAQNKWWREVVVSDHITALDALLKAMKDE